METLRFKNYILILIITLILASCTQGNDKMKIIEFRTDKFNEYVKDAPITLEQAWKIQLNFANTNYSDKMYKIQESESKLFFIVDDHYIFTLGHINSKQVKGFLYDGIWVNAKTGKVFEKKLSKIVQAKQPIGWRYIKK